MLDKLGGKLESQTCGKETDSRIKARDGRTIIVGKNGFSIQVRHSSCAFEENLLLWRVDNNHIAGCRYKCKTLTTGETCREDKAASLAIHFLTNRLGLCCLQHSISESYHRMHCKNNCSDRQGLKTRQSPSHSLTARQTARVE